MRGGEKSSSGWDETSYRGAKRLTLRQVVTATKRLEDGCETSWGRNFYGAKCPGALHKVIKEVIACVNASAFSQSNIKLSKSCTTYVF